MGPKQLSFSYFMIHPKVTELTLQGVRESKSKLRISESAISMQFVEICWLNYLPETDFQVNSCMLNKLFSTFQRFPLCCESLTQYQVEFL
jgi:hypothetical protein